MSMIDDKYAALGGANGFLGVPETPETTCPDGIGKFRHYKGGSIYWHPLTGPWEVHGLIRAKWAKLGWEKSIMGYPKTDESPSGGGAKGKFNLFQGGAITWKEGATEAFETHGAIRSKFGQMGWEAGFLGFPITDATMTPDGGGRYNHFEHGSIYWKSSISAHETHGLIRGYWAQNGWEKNPQLGYPISDELPTYSGSMSRFSDFENGVVFWHSGDKKAATLVPFAIAGASKSLAEVMSAISSGLVSKLKENSRVYINSGPYLLNLTDYSYDGSRVINRRYIVRVDIGIDISGVPDPTSSIDFTFSVNFDRPTGKIWVALNSATAHTHVPWPTSIGLSAKDVNDQLMGAINPVVGVHQNEVTVPGGIHLLSVKVMPNGDLHTFVQPLFEP